MTGRTRALSFACPCVLGLSLLLTATTTGQFPGQFPNPTPAPLLGQMQQKAGICFKNCTNRTVLLQGLSFVNGTILRGPQVVVYPNKTGWDTNPPPGNRYVIISDPNLPNLKLAEGRIPFLGRDLFFCINERGGKLRIEPE